MSELMAMLYHYVLENKIDVYMDERACKRMERQMELEEEKLESLIPPEYKRLLREYGEHMHARTDLDMEALFQATIAFVREFPVC